MIENESGHAFDMDHECKLHIRNEVMPSRSVAKLSDDELLRMAAQAPQFAQAVVVSCPACLVLP
jgi:hypothetical protein